jgi:transposase
MTLPNRRHYSRDFKIGAIKLVTEQGYTVNDAARRLEIHRKSLVEWLAKFAPEFNAAASDDPTTDKPEAQADLLRQLRKDNERLRLENDILKKATAYFANLKP